MKKFLSISLITIMMFLGINGVNAYTSPNSVKVTGTTNTHGYHLFTVEPSGGSHAYCMDITYTAPSNGSTLNKFNMSSSFDQKTLNKMIAVLRTSGDPSYNFGLNEKESFYITQAAFWYAENGSTPMHESLKGNANYQKLINAINEANNGKDFTKNDYSLKITSSDGKVSPDMEVKEINGKLVLVSKTLFKIEAPGEVTVKLSNGYFTNDDLTANGGNSVTMRNGSSFRIAIPISGDKTETKESKVTVTTNQSYVTKYGIEGYSNGKSNYQRLALLFHDEEYLNTEYSVKGSFEYKKTSLKVSKTDATGQKELDGASLTLNDKNGKIEEWKSSSKQAHEIFDINIDEIYEIVENYAPEGYVPLTNSIMFRVNKDKKVETLDCGNVDIKSVDASKCKVMSTEDILKIKNEVEKKTKVMISKRDFTTGEELEGATLRIIDEKGTVVAEWISTSEPYYIETLPVGKYTLVEVLPIEGYNVDMIIDGKHVSEYQFEVTNDGLVKIDVYNELIDVPNTLSNANITYIVGGIIILIGASVIVISRKKNI